MILKTDNVPVIFDPQYFATRSSIINHVDVHMCGVMVSYVFTRLSSRWWVKNGWLKCDVQMNVTSIFRQSFEAWLRNTLGKMLSILHYLQFDVIYSS